MTTLTERGKVLLSIPVDKEVRAFLRSESKRSKMPQGDIVARAIRSLMPPKTCKACEKEPAAESHQCPFRMEIHEDYAFTCNCCKACAHECAMDI